MSKKQKLNVDFESARHREKPSIDVLNGIISDPQLVEVDMNAQRTDNPAHANDKAFVAMCQVV